MSRNSKAESLRKEQEQILFELLQALPESSQETMICDEYLERGCTYGNDSKAFLESVNQVSTVTCTKAGEKRKRCNGIPSEERNQNNRASETPTLSNSYNENKRTYVSKHKEENDDSGFATSSEPYLKLNMSQASFEQEKLSESLLAEEWSDSEGSCTTVESVSLLRTSTATNHDKNKGADGAMSLAWNIKLYPDFVDDEETMNVDKEVPALSEYNKSLQTTSHIAEDEDHCIKRSIDFLCSFLKLKYIFLSKKNISDKKYIEILKNEQSSESWNMEDEGDDVFTGKELCSNGTGACRTAETQTNTISHETIHYIMKTVNADYVLEKSVDFILEWMIEELKDRKSLCNYWKNSAVSDAADVINKVVDSDVSGTQLKVFNFLKTVFNDIHDVRFPVEDSILEFKVIFLSSFCKSIFLLQDFIPHVQKMVIKLINSRKDLKLQTIAIVKASYFSLRLLHELLRSFLVQLNENGFQEIFKAQSQETNSNVIELWKSNWKKSEQSNINHKEDVYRRYFSIISEWYNRSDHILRFCINEAPLLSLVAQKCSALAHKILMQGEVAALKE